nr:MAG TPA: hypothetical protein [Caudoviricetes sp.]
MLLLFLSYIDNYIPIFVVVNSFLPNLDNLFFSFIIEVESEVKV